MTPSVAMIWLKRVLSSEGHENKHFDIIATVGYNICGFISFICPYVFLCLLIKFIIIVLKTRSQ